jgi:hypothetical protein
MSCPLCGREGQPTRKLHLELFGAGAWEGEREGAPGEKGLYVYIDIYSFLASDAGSLGPLAMWCIQAVPQLQCFWARDVRAYIAFMTPRILPASALCVIALESGGVVPTGPLLKRLHLRRTLVANCTDTSSCGASYSGPTDVSRYSM